MALKWYTRARKFPQLIGRTPDGTRIPGGPYTYTQVAAGVVTAVVLAQTTWLWAHGGLILNATIFIGATVGAVFAAGKLTPGMRNPIVLASGALNLMSSGYRLDGTAIRNPKPNTATAAGPVTVFIPAPTLAKPTTTPLTEPVAVPAPIPVLPATEPRPVPGPVLSSVQRLLLGEAS
jgi:hypothetical protein